MYHGITFGRRCCLVGKSVVCKGSVEHIQARYLGVVASAKTSTGMLMVGDRGEGGHNGWFIRPVCSRSSFV